MRVWVVLAALAIGPPSCDGCGGCSEEDEDEGWDCDHDGYTAGEEEGGCSDYQAGAHPGAAEVCDGVDNDCNGVVDDVPTVGEGPWHVDNDGDGYGDQDSDGLACDPESVAWIYFGPDYVSRSDDCDDTDRSVHPGAPEICDGDDNDCDGWVDEDAEDAPTWYHDDDGDGYGDPDSEFTSCDGEDDPYGDDDSWPHDDDPPEGVVGVAGDCDDADPAIHEGAPEFCGDGADQDCDGTVDEVVDEDADGYTNCGGDCDDRVPTTNPGAPEECNGLDDDCDGVVDDGYDLDGDGYSPCAGDCDDSNADHAPGREEICGDTVDEDCAGGPDSGCEYSLADAFARLWGDQPGERAGASVAFAGDVDGDGFGDLLVGAPRREVGGAVLAGMGYLVPGPVEGDLDLAAVAVAKVLGGSAYDYAGTAVAGIGDVDGDGYADIAVGSPGPIGGDDAAAVWIFHGPVAGTLGMADADVRLIPESPSDYSGYALAGGGDLDGDGRPDLLVGAPWYSSSYLSRGLVHVVSDLPDAGDVQLADSRARLIGPASSWSGAGDSLAFPGDVNGDGLGDLLVGAFGGPAWLVWGPVEGTLWLDSADSALDVPVEGSHGIRVGAAGDVDGDGLPDFVLADVAEGEGGIFPGTVEGAFAWTDALARWEGPDTPEQVGHALAAPGDLDGDGADDIAVAGYDPYAGVPGSIYVLHRPGPGEAPLGAMAARYVGESDGDGAGAALAGGSDITGDGLPDLLVGADQSGNGGAGLVYLIAGRPAPER